MTDHDYTRAEAVFADFLAALEGGEDVSVLTLCEQNPDLAGALQVLWAEHCEADEICAELKAGSHWGTLPAPELPASEVDRSQWDALVQRLTSHPETKGRYRLVGRVGEGGMGVVLKVWDEELGRPLAMKVARDAPPDGQGPGSAPVSTSLGRFLEEAQVTGQLDHPGIVPVHELGLDGERRVFFTMRLVQGKNLKAVIEETHQGSSTWTQTRVLGVLLKVCEAVAYAHSKGVIHRDLKPANVMVGRFGEVYTMDWGLAKLTAPSAADAAEVLEAGASEGTDDVVLGADGMVRTRAGAVLGTPAYMAPEQARGERDQVDERSDVYALGAMLYHLLVGHAPFADQAALTARELIRRAAMESPTPLQRLVPGVVPELEAICSKAMSHRSGDRYDSVEELAAELSAYLEQRVVRAYRTGPLAELRKWVMRNRGTAAAVVGGLGLALALLSLLFWVKKRSADDLQSANQSLRLAEADALDHLRDVQRLEDINELRRLREVAATLWPAVPANVPAMEEWLRAGDELAHQLPLHEAFLAELHQGGSLPQRVAGSLPRREHWLPDLVSDFVTELRAFVDPAATFTGMAEMRRRVEGARTLVERSIAAHAEKWEDACDEILLGDLYDGLELEPQLGLVPLGPDPVTGLWEFAVLDSGALPRRDPDDQRLAIRADMAIVLVLIPGGTFAMGTQRDDAGTDQYESGPYFDTNPLHAVHLAPFFLSKYELTQGQWERLTGNRPSLFPLDDPDASLQIYGVLPVEHVSHRDAIVALQRVGLVLPTEAQWEYAARAGTTTRWWCGDDPAEIGRQQAGNLHDRSAQRPDWGDPERWNDSFAAVAPVGSFAANPFALHDTVGNLLEWCQDSYGSYNLPVRPGDGLRLVPATAPNQRIYRGGSYDFRSENAMVYKREHNTPGTANYNLGVRPARRLDGAGSERTHE